jgi:hypothetical protein
MRGGPANDSGYGSLVNDAASDPTNKRILINYRA